MDTLIVPLRSPPVPHASMSRSVRSDPPPPPAPRRRPWRRPSRSSRGTVSPLQRKPNMKAAICAGVAFPSRISVRPAPRLLGVQISRPAGQSAPRARRAPTPDSVEQRRCRHPGRGQAERRRRRMILRRSPSAAPPIPRRSPLWPSAHSRHACCTGHWVQMALASSASSSDNGIENVGVDTAAGCSLPPDGYFHILCSHLGGPRVEIKSRERSKPAPDRLSVVWPTDTGLSSPKALPNSRAWAGRDRSACGLPLGSLDLTRCATPAVRPSAVLGAARRRSLRHAGRRRGHHRLRRGARRRRPRAASRPRRSRKTLRPAPPRSRRSWCMVVSATCSSTITGWCIQALHERHTPPGQRPPPGAPAAVPHPALRAGRDSGGPGVARRLCRGPVAL